MKIKSLIRFNSLDVKSVILKKYTLTEITSEDFFGIPAQPKNTCPIIDKAKEDNDHLIDKLYSFQKDAENYLKVRVREEDECNCHEALQDSLKDIDIYNDSVKDAQTDLDNLNRQLEILRSNCEQTRMFGQDLKDALWKFYDKKISLEELIREYNRLNDLRPKEIINNKTLEKTFNKIDLSVPKFNDFFCKNHCSSCRDNSSLESCFDSMHIEMDYSNHIDEAFENFYLIQKWVVAVESLVENISKESEISYSKEEAREYLSLYNEKQKYLFETEQSVLSSIKAVSIEKELDEFIRNTEKTTIGKKIKDFENEVNQMITEFKSFDLSSNYDSLVVLLGGFFIKVSDLKTRLDALWVDDKPVDLNKALLPLRTPINSINKFLVENGPQVFEIEDF